MSGDRPEGEHNVLRPQWRQQPPDPPAGPGPVVRAAIPLVLVVVGVGWLLWARTESSRTSPYVDIAVVAAPRVEFSKSLPESAEAGMMDLARGDCQTAAAHFRTAARRNPDQPRIRVLEGASLVCAGRADEARKVLEPLTDSPDAAGQLWWYLAQACLLEGDADCALDALEQASQGSPRHRERAIKQRRQLQERLSAPGAE